MITDRNLQPGTILIAKYRGAEHRALVGEGGGIVLADHRTASSVSQAAGMITGTSVNGWKFWTVSSAPWEPEAMKGAQLVQGEQVATVKAHPHRGAQATWWCACGAENNEPFRTCHNCDAIKAPAKKRRSKRDAHNAAIDRPINAAPAAAAVAVPAELRGQGFITANVCSECGGPLRPRGGEFHERAYPQPPVCCSCKATLTGRPCSMMAAAS